MPQRICPACLARGEPALHSGTHVYCERDRKHKDRARGTRQQRGYDRSHEQERARLLAEFTPGQACAIGGEPLASTARLDLAHNADRSGWLGLACWDCNRGHR